MGDARGTPSNPTVIVNGIGIPCGVVATLLVDVPADDLPDAVVGDQLEGEVAAYAVPCTGDEDGLIVDWLRRYGDELPINRLEQTGGTRRKCLARRPPFSPSLYILTMTIAAMTSHMT